MPGPSKSPTITLEKRGSWRAKKRGDANFKTSGTIEMPNDLTPQETYYWDELTNALKPLGILTKVDVIRLSKLASLMAEYDEMNSQFKKEFNSNYYIEENGKLKKNPIRMMMFELDKQIDRLSKEFGMTPSARASLSLSSPFVETSKDKSRFFSD